MTPFALAAAATNQQRYTASLGREFWRPPMVDVCAAAPHLLRIPPARPSPAPVARAIALALIRGPCTANEPK